QNDCGGRPPHAALLNIALWPAAQTLRFSRCGAVAGCAHPTIAAAQKAMGGLKPLGYKPKAANVAVYNKLYLLYKKLHDVFGTRAASANCADVMKELLRVRTQAVAR
ncbi:MAG: hypothetical protein NTV22_09895, partial [bacterium]|nr:hypothetical protein [bacterium]